VTAVRLFCEQRSGPAVDARLLVDYRGFMLRRMHICTQPTKGEPNISNHFVGDGPFLCPHSGIGCLEQGRAISMQ